MLSGDSTEGEAVKDNGLAVKSVISEGSDGMSLWRLAGIVRIIFYAVVGGFLAICIFVLGEDVARHIDSIEAWVAGLGPWALVIFVLMYALLGTVFVPDMVLGMIAGTTFGFTRGLLAAFLGSLAGAILQYSLSRRLLRPAVEKVLTSRPSLVAILAAVRQQEFRLQFLIRLTPINRTLTNYILGASGVGILRFIAACIGFLPTLCLEVYIGYAGRQMIDMAGPTGRAAVVEDVLLVAGLTAAVIVLVVVTRMARRAVEVAADTSQHGPRSGD